MDKKEQWANEVLQSLEGIQRAKPNANLFAEITAKLPKKTVKIIPLKRLRWAAVAACVIIAANIYVFSSGINQTQQNITTNAEEYGLVTDYALYK